MEYDDNSKYRVIYAVVFLLILKQEEQVWIINKWVFWSLNMNINPLISDFAYPEFDVCIRTTAPLHAFERLHGGI